MHIPYRGLYTWWGGGHRLEPKVQLKRFMLAAEQITQVQSQEFGRNEEAFSAFHAINPLLDDRWPEFLCRHSQASVFHTRAWLEALRLTYGYEPVAFTTSPAREPLDDGVVLCVIRTWLVQPRLISLPFSDHCQPLIRDEVTLQNLLAFLESRTKAGQWTNVEFRAPNTANVFGDWSNFTNGQQFTLHTLDLTDPLELIFRRFNKDSTQRKIRRAERVGLVYEEGQSEELVQDFFRLVVITRRRKCLPPPAIDWYRNVVNCFGHDAKIRVARTKEGKPAGAILTLSFKGTMLFKYGASDARYHRLGTMPFLLWKAIEDAKLSGADTFDFGRSEIGNTGLIHFKAHFGAEQKVVTHKVFPASSWAPSDGSKLLWVAKKVFAILPDALLIQAGKLIYPHIG